MPFNTSSPQPISASDWQGRHWTRLRCRRWRHHRNRVAGVLAAGGEIIGVIPETLIARELGSHQFPDLHIASTIYGRKLLMHSRSNVESYSPVVWVRSKALSKSTRGAELGFHSKPIIVVNVNGRSFAARDLTYVLESSTSHNLAWLCRRLA